MVCDDVPVTQRERIPATPEGPQTLPTQRTLLLQLCLPPSGPSESGSVPERVGIIVIPS